MAMDSLGLPVLGWLWGWFKSYWPSPVDIICRERIEQDGIQLNFALKNLGNVPIKDYALTVTIPEEMYQLYRSKNRRGETSSGYVSVSFAGPYVSPWLVDGEQKPSTSENKPLLPAGPSVVVAAMEFRTRTKSRGDVVEILCKHPIKLEFWGGFGRRQTTTFFFRQTDDGLKCLQSAKPFSAEIKRLTQKPEEPKGS